MAGEFDDHATVVALELLLKHVIIRDCLTRSDAITDWTETIAAKRAALGRVAAAAPHDLDITQRAVDVAGELHRIFDDIGVELRRRAVPPSRRAAKPTRHPSSPWLVRPSDAASRKPLPPRSKRGRKVTESQEDRAERSVPAAANRKPTKH